MVVGQAGACFMLSVVVGQTGACFMLGCCCGASKSVFHVKLWLHAKQEYDS